MEGQRELKECGESAKSAREVEGWGERSTWAQKGSGRPETGGDSRMGSTSAGGSNGEQATSGGQASPMGSGERSWGHTSSEPPRLAAKASQPETSLWTSAPQASPVVSCSRSQETSAMGPVAIGPAALSWSDMSRPALDRQQTGSKLGNADQDQNGPAAIYSSDMHPSPSSCPAPQPDGLPSAAAQSQPSAALADSLVVLGPAPPTGAPAPQGNRTSLPDTLLCPDSLLVLGPAPPTVAPDSQATWCSRAS